MAWNNIATTMAVAGFGAVVWFAGWTLVPKNDYQRIDRTCNLLNVAKDEALKRSDARSVESENYQKYIKLMKYLYGDVCVTWTAKYLPLYSQNTTPIVLAYDKFRDFLKNKKLDASDIALILDTGVQSNINWQDEAQTYQLYQEFVDYKNQLQQGPQ